MKIALISFLMIMSGFGLLNPNQPADNSSVKIENRIYTTCDYYSNAAVAVDSMPSKPMMQVWKEFKIDKKGNFESSPFVTEILLSNDWQFRSVGDVGIAHIVAGWGKLNRKDTEGAITHLEFLKFKLFPTKTSYPATMYNNVPGSEDEYNALIKAVSVQLQERQYEISLSTNNKFKKEESKKIAELMRYFVNTFFTGAGGNCKIPAWEMITDGAKGVNVEIEILNCEKLKIEESNLLPGSFPPINFFKVLELWIERSLLDPNVGTINRDSLKKHLMIETNVSADSLKIGSNGINLPGFSIPEKTRYTRILHTRGGQTYKSEEITEKDILRIEGGKQYGNHTSIEELSLLHTPNEFLSLARGYQVVHQLGKYSNADVSMIVNVYLSDDGSEYRYVKINMFFPNELLYNYVNMNDQADQDAREKRFEKFIKYSK